MDEEASVFCDARPELSVRPRLFDLGVVCLFRFRFLFEFLPWTSTFTSYQYITVLLCASRAPDAGG